MATKTNTLTPAETSRQALADAQADLASAKAERNQLRADFNRMRNGLQSGIHDGTLTEGEYFSTRGRLDYAELQIEGLQAAVKRAERRLITDDISLAESVAVAVRDAVRGVDVLAVNEIPADPPALPVLFVVQTEDSKPPKSRDGRITGTVELVYVRAEVHREIDTVAIADALRDNGVSFPDHTRDPLRSRSTSNGGNLEDRITVDVRSAWPVGVPTVGKPGSAHNVRHVGSALASRVVRAMQRPTQPTPSVAANSRAEIASSTDDADGLHRLTVEAVVTADNQDGAYTSRDFRERLSEIVEALPGEPFSGLGRVESVDVLTCEPMKSGNATNGAVGFAGGRLVFRAVLVCKVAE